MKKVKHWLHILLVVLTSGLWLIPYVAILACTEQYNRGYRVGKVTGRVERSNEYEVARSAHFTAAPTVSRVDRFAELADRNRQVGLDEYERAEYSQLRAELSR